MTELRAIEFSLQVQALHELYSRNGVERRTRFIERAPEWLLQKLVTGARHDDTARYVLTNAVTDLRYWTAAEDISGVTENQKTYDYHHVSIFCDLADWYELFTTSSFHDFGNGVDAVHRNILASTNDFSASAVKAKFLIHHFRLDWGLSHDEYNDGYQFLKDHMDAVGKRLSMVITEAGKSGEITLAEIREIVEVPLALADGLI